MAIHTSSSVDPAWQYNARMETPTPSPLPAQQVASHSHTGLVIGAMIVGLLVGAIGMWAFCSMQKSAPKSARIPGETQVAANTSAVVTNIVGVYTLVGSAGGVTYQGTVTIAPRGTTPNLYDLQWRVGENQVQTGTGILSGNVLSVGFVDVSGGTINDAGPVSYISDRPGHFTGSWASIIGGKIGSEELTLSAGSATN